MKYISEFKALNLECPLNTPGDWHFDVLDWNNIKYKESEDSIFEDWGLYVNKSVPNHKGEDIYVADHLRAILDIFQTNGIKEVGGFRYDYICDDELDEILFEKVLMLKQHKNWELIDKIMTKEYLKKWNEYKENH